MVMISLSAAGKAAPDGVVRRASVIQRVQPLGQHGIEPPRTAVADRCAAPECRPDEALAFEPSRVACTAPAATSRSSRAATSLRIARP